MCACVFVDAKISVIAAHLEINLRAERHNSHCAHALHSRHEHVQAGQAGNKQMKITKMKADTARADENRVHEHRSTHTTHISTSTHRVS